MPDDKMLNPKPAVWNTRKPAASPVAGVSQQDAELDEFESLTRWAVDDFSTQPMEDSDCARLKKLRASLYQRLRAQPSAEGDGWIAVSDDMPKFGEDVLTFTPPQPKWGHSAKRRVSRIIMYSGKREMAWFDGDINQFITHWSPLLPAPVAKEGRES